MNQYENMESFAPHPHGEVLPLAPHHCSPSLHIRSFNMYLPKTICFYPHQYQAEKTHQECFLRFLLKNIKERQIGGRQSRVT